MQQATSFPALPAELDFDPVREPATRNGNVIDGRFWVINPLNDEIIGDGKRVHNPHNYRKMWDSMWEGLMQSDLDMSTIEVKTRVIENGAAMRAEVILPNQDFTGQLGEAAKMKIVIADSHDQTIKRSVSAMVHRLACLNGMIAVREKIAFSQKHTTFSDPLSIGIAASNWIPQLQSEVEGMKQMMGIRIGLDQAVEFYRQNVARYRTASGYKFNERMLERILNIHNSYDMGHNAYRVYNTLTHLSTHVDKAKGDADIGRKQLRIEQDIESVIRGPFAEMIAV